MTRTRFHHLTVCLLGEGGFAAHVVFGVAVAKDYYVILACPEEGT